MCGYKKRFSSKFDEHLIFIPNVKILNIEEQNKEINGKFKSVFYVESKSNPKGKMCISWNKTFCKIGDFVDLKARAKDDVLLVYSMMIKYRQK